jgi:hypothetical protein
MLPPECQVCDNFDVHRTTCCGTWVSAEFHGPDISEFVRREYPNPATTVTPELFRLLNEDIRYELRSLYEDTTAWSAYISFDGTKPENLPPAATRMAQTSAFVHIRVLSYFFMEADDKPDETRAPAFDVSRQESSYMVAWRDAINSNVMHLHRLRPRAVVVLRDGRTRNAPPGVQLEVGKLADAIARMWHVFIGDDKAMKPYEKLTAHIDEWAVNGAAATRAHLTGLVGVADGDMWHPPGD